MLYFFRHDLYTGVIMNTTIEQIMQLKQEKDAVILAHYYVPDEVQAIADYVGDSFYLSKVATTVPQKTIVFCGVFFMGESAKILNPDKTILMPDLGADCPMAHMADPDTIQSIREKYDDLAVVCYINSSAELKTYADVCVTSSNAIKIVRALPETNIYFIPDENLGRYIAGLLPEKHFIFNDGFCHVHASITAEDVQRAKESHPDAKILAHPECTAEVLALADYIGSTTGIIDYATAEDHPAFIVCTEVGVLYQLEQRNPDKKFYIASTMQLCPNMKKVSLNKVLEALQDGAPEVVLDEALARDAVPSLARMMELGS